MSNLLITGGAGFIGTNFVRYWRANYPNDVIFVLDALTYAGSSDNLRGVRDVEFVHGDIRDFELTLSLLRRHRLDTIVNFAAESHVDRSIHGPDIFIDTNVVGTLALLKAAKVAWLDTGSGIPHRFHHVSTDEVYGSLEPGEAAFTENTPFSPNSPYSASKAASDHLVRAYHRTYGLQTSTTNCSNNYGPYQFPEKLIPLFLINVFRNKPLPIYGDGGNIRDWLHVADHCRAIELVLANGRVGETYNVGGGVELPNIKVVREICRGVDAAFSANPDLAHHFPDAPAANGRGSAELMTFVNDRLGHDRRYAIDERKIRSELGYAPQFEFAEGLSQTLAWYLENPDWWRKRLGAGK